MLRKSRLEDDTQNKLVILSLLKFVNFMVGSASPNLFTVLS
jgi:hypothetical protein